jgi:hypothetical protein
MMILALIISAVLLVLAAIHMLWGFGYWFPYREEERLVAAVVGTRDVTRMPGPIPCGLVSGSLVMLLIVLWGREHPAQDWIVFGAAVVLTVRGAVTYLGFWRYMTPQEPFASYDRRYYAPLCLALALGLAIAQSIRF